MYSQRTNELCKGAKPSAKFRSVACPPLSKYDIEQSWRGSETDRIKDRVPTRPGATQNRLQRGLSPPGTRGGNLGTLGVYRNPTPSEYEIRYVYNEIVPWCGALKKRRPAVGTDMGRGTRNRGIETRKGGDRRSKGQEILDLRDAYSQCDVYDSRSILYRRVSRISAMNDRLHRRMLKF